MIKTVLLPSQDSSAKNNISSYFSNIGDDIFDSLGAPDAFQSIAISKSLEDVRASEMNAREITESEVLGSTQASGGIPRNHSFARKQEEAAKFFDEIQSDSNEVEEAKESEVVESDEKTVEEEEVTLINHVEQKASSCEPETIAFVGEL